MIHREVWTKRPGGKKRNQQVSENKNRPYNKHNANNGELIVIRVK